MKASIIIPVKKESQQLLAGLEALQEQEISLIKEVIIVENGSNEIRELKQYNFSTQLIHHRKPGRSLARNLGARLASGEILIFLDADVVLEKNWVQSVMSAFDQDTLAVQTQNFPQSHKNDLLFKIRLVRSFQLNHQTFFSLKKDEPYQVVMDSAAMAVRADIFFQMGGFDELLGRHEDFDFTQRLIQYTGKIKCLKSSHAHVYYTKTLFSLFLREMDLGYHRVRFYEKWFPEPSLKVLKILGNRCLGFFLGLPKLYRMNELNRSLYFMEFMSIVGNVGGFLRMLFYPYRGTRPKTEYKAKIIFE